MLMGSEYGSFATVDGQLSILRSGGILGGGVLVGMYRWQRHAKRGSHVGWWPIGQRGQQLVQCYQREFCQGRFFRHLCSLNCQGWIDGRSGLGFFWRRQRHLERWWCDE
jgi:hypothetical protein